MLVEWQVCVLEVDSALHLQGLKESGIVFHAVLSGPESPAGMAARISTAVHKRPPKGYPCDVAASELTKASHDFVVTLCTWLWSILDIGGYGEFIAELSHTLL